MFNIPPPLDGNKLCLIVGICQSDGGTVILMLPPESRNLLDDIDIFSTMEGLRFRPRGIGLTLSRDIDVLYRTTELEIWNGYELFRYPYV